MKEIVSKKVLFIFSCFLFSMLLITLGIIGLLTKLKNEQIINETKKTIRTNCGVRDLGKNLSGVTGMVEKIVKDLITLRCGEKIFLIKITDQTSFDQFPWIFRGDLSARVHQPIEKTTFKSLLSGEYLDIFGLLENERTISALTVMVYREGAK